MYVLPSSHLFDTSAALLCGCWIRCADPVTLATDTGLPAKGPHLCPRVVCTLWTASGISKLKAAAVITHPDCQQGGVCAGLHMPLGMGEQIDFDQHSGWQAELDLATEQLTGS